MECCVCNRTVPGERAPRVRTSPRAGRGTQQVISTDQPRRGLSRYGDGGAVELTQG
jgi:hypothetical protein